MGLKTSVRIPTNFILGMGKVNQRVVTVLHIDRVLTEREIALVEASAKTTEPQPNEFRKDKNPQGKDVKGFSHFQACFGW